LNHVADGREKAYRWILLENSEEVVEEIFIEHFVLSMRRLEQGSVEARDLFRS